MPSFVIPAAMPINPYAILETTLEKSKELAVTLFKRFTEQARSDAKDFLQHSKRRGSPCCGTTATGQLGKDEQGEARHLFL